MDKTQPDPPRSTSPLQVIQSVAWSFFGVQSSRNRERDFSQGRALHFLVAALLMTGLVALIFLGAVQLVLRFAAP